MSAKAIIHFSESVPAILFSFCIRLEGLWMSVCVCVCACVCVLWYWQPHNLPKQPDTYIYFILLCDLYQLKANTVLLIIPPPPQHALSRGCFFFKSFFFWSRLPSLMQGALCQPGLSAHPVLTGRPRETWKGEERASERTRKWNSEQKGEGSSRTSKMQNECIRTAINEEHTHAQGLSQSSGCWWLHILYTHTHTDVG